MVPKSTAIALATLFSTVFEESDTGTTLFPRYWYAFLRCPPTEKFSESALPYPTPNASADGENFSVSIKP